MRVLLYHAELAATPECTQCKVIANEHSYIQAHHTSAAYVCTNMNTSRCSEYVDDDTIPSCDMYALNMPTP